jgi:hypothetical protein
MKIFVHDLLTIEIVAMPLYQLSYIKDFGFIPQCAFSFQQYAFRYQAGTGDRGWVGQQLIRYSLDTQPI